MMMARAENVLPEERLNTIDQESRPFDFMIVYEFSLGGISIAVPVGKT